MTRSALGMLCIVGCRFSVSCFSCPEASLEGEFLSLNKFPDAGILQRVFFDFLFFYFFIFLFSSRLKIGPVKPQVSSLATSEISD